MKMRTQLLIVFLTISILPLIYIGVLIAMDRSFLLYQPDGFRPEAMDTGINNIGFGIIFVFTI